ncbi:2'-5' RNA ligase family protein [Devosia sp.]|uniref:2'-5' RNA ligase family protein n=1 Tax=Devosia sp. TaxID=1871048 RepID=UPI00292D56DB|nr:2'-5' RNA ligase family protein [Devosia sp.]
MALALSLVFDDAAVSDVRALWQALADAGISRDMLDLAYPPHVTLVVADDEGAEEAMRRALQQGRGRAVSIALGRVSRFAGTQVVWLACDGGEPLMSLHADIAAQLPLDAIRPYYRPDQWTPHMTLQTVGDAEAAMAVAHSLWRIPPLLRATRLELARFLPVQVLDGVSLDA